MRSKDAQKQLARTSLNIHILKSYETIHTVYLGLIQLSLQRSLPLSHVRERKGAKQSGRKESGEELRRSNFAVLLLIMNFVTRR